MQALQEINLNDYPIVQQTQAVATVSERYSQIPTTAPTEIIRDFGWKPHEVVQIQSRDKDMRNFAKHRIRFFNPDLPMVNGSALELLLTNSHNGNSSFQLQMGVFRMVCANGLIAGDTYQKQSVRHVGYTEEKVENAVKLIANSGDRLGGDIEKFSCTVLSENEKRAYAEAAIKMRLDGDKYKPEDYDYMADSFMRPVRNEDFGNDLWTVMNVAQEKLLRRGFRVYGKATAKDIGFKKIRAIKSFNEQDKINKMLWDFTEALAN